MSHGPLVSQPQLTPAEPTRSTYGVPILFILFSFVLEAAALWANEDDVIQDILSHGFWSYCKLFIIH